MIIHQRYGWQQLSCNYSSRSGTAISAVTIHTIQGSYAGAISWFQNCAASVSAHYVIRSSDGQVTQMVLESDKAWHVGSENPYTIGFEHEGFVDDASWYTPAMYESSADIVRDIVDSGYGINPLRAYNGPSCSSSSTCLLGGCIKIKGHQHFPNQSHTDPGENWDWVKFYNLINNGTSASTETASSGTACDSGGAAANYGDDERTLLKISPASAISITLDFSTFDLEANWDYLTIYEGGTVDDPIVGTYTGTAGPGNLTVNSAEVLIEFRSDCATTNPGYCFFWTTTVADIIAPTTMVGTIPDPVNADFSVAFTDSDNVGGSGVDDRYFLVADFDGTEWRSNSTYGFYYDDFSTVLHSDWTTYSGTWDTASGALVQTDVANSNTNVYASVDQNLADEYLYHWKGKISGSGTNQRAGIHFFCDDAAFANRNNSYFIYFRESSDLLQLYKVINDTWTLEVDLPFSFALDQYYDFKIFFNKVSGQIDIYIDDVKELSWTDPSPHNTGNYVSFRSGNCIYTVDDFRVQKRRTSTEVVTVGDEPSNMVRYQNPAPSSPSGMIRSIVRDNSDNISTEAVGVFNVELTGLPVELMDFSAKAMDNFIRIDWRVGQEVDLWGYALERSVDGFSFEEVAKIKSTTSSDVEFSYDFEDRDVVKNQLYYYRLRMIDLDGAFKFSSVVSVELKSSAPVLGMYPNPAADLLHIHFYEDELFRNGSYSFMLYNQLGQVVTEVFLDHPISSVDVSKLGNGVYLGVVFDADGVVLHRGKVSVRR